MSRSRPPARLVVPAGRSSLEIDVVDADFAPVASGVSALDVELAPGLYEIHFREGTASEMRLVKLGPGDNIVPAPEFAPASPAPVEQTATSFDYHQEPVLEATSAIDRDCAAPGPESGGIVVMVRNVRGQETVKFPDDLRTRLIVVDAKLEPVDQDGDDWVDARERTGGRAPWALWSRAVTPGGYALRIERPGASDVLYQSLWVGEGWQTSLFIPNTDAGPAPELATAHITRVGQWTPSDEGSTVALALESVLTGLRSGRPVVPAHLDALFQGKFVNPFLGIAGAHALFAMPEPSLGLAQTVIKNLERLMPGNPDVVALGHRARSLGAMLAPREGVFWPPMMDPGYRALLHADATSPGAILDGSPAEVFAGRARVAGLWTTWAAEPSRGLARSIGERIGIVGERADPAVERVLAYIEGAAAVGRTNRAGLLSDESLLSKESVTRLALKTGLPSASVRNAVRKLKADL
jgi:hypothetical protein